MKPYLNSTQFSDLKEIRNYQKTNAEKVSLIDKRTDFNIIGIINTRLIEDLAYSGIITYNINDKEIMNTFFQTFKPIFTEYFSSILYLNQTEIYLDLIKNIDIIPDCYILNASGQMHPYFYGAACDFGLQIETAVMGYTKKLLFGELRINKEKSNISQVYSEEKLIGYAIPKLNTKKFYYVSVGNNISLLSALTIFTQLDLGLFSSLRNDLNNYIQNRKRGII